jgi:hypothetical protein
MSRQSVKLFWKHAIIGPGDPAKESHAGRVAGSHSPATYPADNDRMRPRKVKIAMLKPTPYADSASLAVIAQIACFYF